MSATSDLIAEDVQTIREKLSWIDTGKAAKYKELPATYHDIKQLAEHIVWLCEGQLVQKGVEHGN